MSYLFKTSTFIRNKILYPESMMKKTWKTPEIIVLDTANVRSGASPSFHENTMTGLVGNGATKTGHVTNGPRKTSFLHYNQANIS